MENLKYQHSGSEKFLFTFVMISITNKSC